jgi:hypothetical protein
MGNDTIFSAVLKLRIGNNGTFQSLIGKVQLRTVPYREMRHAVFSWQTAYTVRSSYLLAWMEPRLVSRSHDDPVTMIQLR